MLKWGIAHKKEEERQKHLCFVGAPGAGKTVALCLLHLTASHRSESNKELGYSYSETSDSGLSLVKISDQLNRGIDIDKTQPGKFLLNGEMNFTFHRHLSSKSLLASANDASGELFNPLCLPLDINKNPQQPVGLAINQNQLNQFTRAVFESEAYVFIVNGEAAYLEKNDYKPKGRETQVTYLSNFVSNIQRYQRSLKEPTLKGFGILITKVDKYIDAFHGGKNNQQIPFGIDDFKSYLDQGVSAYRQLCGDYKIPVNFYYSRLQEIDDSNKDNKKQRPLETHDIAKPKFVCTKDGIVYSRDEYNRMIDWFRQLAK